MWLHELLKTRLQGLLAAAGCSTSSPMFHTDLHFDVPLTIVLKTLELELEDRRESLK